MPASRTLHIDITGVGLRTTTISTPHASIIPRWVNPCCQLSVRNEWTISQVITTRSYDERLDTISAVRDAGISVCSGGILGLGESDKDRVGLIWEVSK